MLLPWIGSRLWANIVPLLINVWFSVCALLQTTRQLLLHTTDQSSSRAKASFNGEIGGIYVFTMLELKWLETQNGYRNKCCDMVCWIIKVDWAVKVIRTLGRGELAPLITASCLFLCQTQRMEGERERLNQRISALTEKLADAKCANSVETFNVRSLPTS